MDPASIREKVTRGVDTRYIKEENFIHTRTTNQGHIYGRSIEPLTLNLETNNLNSSETSENLRNGQISCAEEEVESSKSSHVHDTETTELEEKYEEDNTETKVIEDEGEEDGTEITASEEEWETNNRKKEKRKVSCKICKETFPSSHKLYRHMSSHKSTCVICDKVFHWKFLYEGHMREHAGEQTPYWCEFCEKKFSTTTQVQSHHALHAKKGKFDCSDCGAMFSRRDNYEAHMKLHADPEKNKCEVCGNQYSSPSNLRKHMAIHQDEKPYHCVVCDKGFNFKNSFEYHMNSHTGKESRKPFECKDCNLSFQCKRTYTSHMNIHTGAKPFACGVCGMAFAQLSTKQGHELTHGSPSRKQIVTETEEQRTQNIALSYDCNRCFLSFTRQIYLVHHLLKSHKVSQDDIGTSSNHEFYLCGVCGKSCKDSGELTSHAVETHCHVQQHLNALSNGKRHTMGDTATSGAAVFKCKICEKKLTQATVRSHVRSHSEKRFVCRVCGMKFHVTTYLSRHMRIHTGETPFHCTKCDQKFRIVESLKKHLREHVGKQTLEKKYECETCGKMFVDNYHLKRHGRSHMKKYKCRTCRTNFVSIDMFEKHKLTHSQQ